MDNPFFDPATWNDILKDWDTDNPFDLMIEEDVKCECGSEKAYGTTQISHSDWCPKHDENL